MNIVSISMESVDFASCFMVSIFFLGGSEAHAFHSLLGTSIFGLIVFLRPASAALRYRSCCVVFLQASAVISSARFASGLPLIPVPLSFFLLTARSIGPVIFGSLRFSSARLVLTGSPAAAVLRRSFSVPLLFSLVLASLAAQIAPAPISLPRVKSRSCGPFAAHDLFQFSRDQEFSSPLRCCLR
jgi:hypothetical protein